ncbi:hypothetical protein FALBO_16887 [Fusarium albosuccineum]|uniref:SSCRP protein n=1 Tax=Fusarium albosuccineum TaxID=1237068 RepID=A0A8H4NX71_9HYPO|nr:hypothetical protein FALBO_16887 [Fusarium albosuccineum]
MKLLLPSLLLAAGHAINTYYTMSVHAPSVPEIHGRVINARNKSFIIGASLPSTFCDLDNTKDCPDGTSTQVDHKMTALAAAVPGGQFIFVSPDGNISYPSAHSSLRPPGSKIGGFRGSQVVSDCNSPVNILMWMPENGGSGLWACPRGRHVPISKEAVLKATTGRFKGKGCLPVDGVEIETAGENFAAWAYT